jgi:TRAP-type C4-dicarboxylate transport system substrate-binding protein
VHSVGNIYTGLNCYFSTKEFKTFDDLKGLKIGCQDSAPLDGLGLSGVYVDVPDYYDSLERGVVDGGTFSFDGLVALKLYEPAPNVMLDTGKTWGMPFCIRNDLWDSFSPELQQIFNDSMAAAQEYGVELVNENIELSKGSLAEQGATVGTLSEEDSQRSFEAQLVASIASGMKRAKEAGVEDQMLALEKKALELYGLDETKYLAEYE